MSCGDASPRCSRSRDGSWENDRGQDAYKRRSRTRKSSAHAESGTTSHRREGHGVEYQDESQYSERNARRTSGRESTPSQSRRPSDRLEPAHRRHPEHYRRKRCSVSPEDRSEDGRALVVKGPVNGDPISGTRHRDSSHHRQRDLSRESRRLHRRYDDRGDPKHREHHSPERNRRDRSRSPPHMGRVQRHRRSSSRSSDAEGKNLQEKRSSNRSHTNISSTRSKKRPFNDDAREAQRHRLGPDASKDNHRERSESPIEKDLHQSTRDEQAPCAGRPQSERSKPTCDVAQRPATIITSPEGRNDVSQATTGAPHPIVVLTVPTLAEETETLSLEKPSEAVTIPQSLEAPSESPSLSEAEKKKLERIQRVRRLMEEKKKKGLVLPSTSTTDSTNATCSSTPEPVLPPSPLAPQAPAETASTTEPASLSPDFSEEVSCPCFNSPPTPVQPIQTEKPLRLTCIQSTTLHNPTTTADVTFDPTVPEDVDSLDIFMEGITTEIQQLQHTQGKKSSRKRRRKDRMAPSAAVESIATAETAQSGAPPVRTSITLEEIMALTTTTESHAASPKLTTADASLTVSSVTAATPCLAQTLTATEAPTSSDAAIGGPPLFTIEAPIPSIPSDATGDDAEALSDDAYYAEFIQSIRRQQGAEPATPQQNDTSIADDDARRPTDSAAAADKAESSGSSDSHGLCNSSVVRFNGDAPSSPGRLEGQNATRSMPATGACSSERLDTTAKAKTGDNSHTQTDNNEDEDKGEEELLGDTEDDDYRYNVVEGDDAPTYFDLVQKVGNKKELPPVDHSTIDYLPFRKNLYIQVREITMLKDHEVDAIRKLHGGIRIRGRLCPRPISSFCQCGLPDPILRVMEKKEFEQPFPIQMQAIPALMAGRDVIGIAETGSGKTLAYLLPLIRHILDQPSLRNGAGPIGLILVPTRELAVQIQKEAHRYTKVVNLRSIAVYGGTGIGEQLSALKRGAEMVVATPGRLIDVATINSGKVTNLRSVTFCVLDEADRMFDLGFEPQIMSIMKTIRPDRQTALFSATFPPQIEGLARRILKKPLEITVGDKGQTASRIEQYVEVWGGYREKFLRLLQLLGEWNEHGSIIIFVSRQTEADDLFAELLKYGYPSLVLHGGQDQTDRDFTIQDFKDGVKSILVATSVAARGLDVKSVVLVINFVAPDHLEDYVHRIGRTGRAGNIGVAYTFLTAEDADKADDLIKALKQVGRDIPEALQQLADEFRVKCNMGLARQRKKKGFGGKGFKFTTAEKSRQQQERQRAKKEMGMNESDEEDNNVLEPEELENPMAPMPAPSPTPPLLNASSPTILPPAGTGVNDVESASVRAKALAELVSRQAAVGSGPTGNPGTAVGMTSAAVTQAAAAAAAAALPKLLGTTPATEEKTRQLAALRTTIQQQLAASGSGSVPGAPVSTPSLLPPTIIPPQGTGSVPGVAVAAQRNLAQAIALAAGRVAATTVALNVPVGATQTLGTIPGLSGAAYIDPATGNAVDEFDINDYPQYARFKITHKDVLHRISDQCGAVLQVKGRYVPPEEKSSPLLLGVKRLYIEIIGSTPVIVQRAKHEIRTLLEAVSLKQLNSAATLRPTGRYSVV